VRRAPRRASGGAQMEATYRSRLEGGGTEERHLEKLNLYKQASARKAERDATASHLQLVERVKEYERALVSGEEAHAAALADAHAQHEARMADALARHAAELRGVQAAHEAQLRTLSTTSLDGRGPQAALKAASQRVEQLASELAALHAENESLREMLAANESRAAAELSEKEAQLSCNMRLVRARTAARRAHARGGRAGRVHRRERVRAVEPPSLSSPRAPALLLARARAHACRSSNPSSFNCATTPWRSAG
jgi:septal ring factor EnvC (AmiA/AmiB activator)